MLLFSQTLLTITHEPKHHFTFQSSFLLSPWMALSASHSGPQLHTASSAICRPAQCLGWVTQSWSALSVFVSSCRSLMSVVHGPTVWLLDMPLCSVRLVLPEGLFEVTEGPNVVWDFFQLCHRIMLAALCLFTGSTWLRHCHCPGRAHAPAAVKWICVYTH